MAEFSMKPAITTNRRVTTAHQDPCENPTKYAERPIGIGSISANLVNRLPSFDHVMRTNTGPYHCAK